MNRYTKGFSLIELMIVIAIVAVLAMISIPNFISYLAKAKRAEAYMHLHAIYAAQKSYWAEHGTYAASLKEIGWQPEGYQGGGENEHFYYTYGFPNGAEGVAFVTGKLQTSAAYLQPSFAHKDAFVVTAAGDIDNDGQPDIITIDHHNVITIVEDDLK